jgi:hypothetical protein
MKQVANRSKSHGWNVRTRNRTELEALVQAAMKAGASASPGAAARVADLMAIYLDNHTPLDYGTIVRVTGCPGRGGSSFYESTLKGVIWKVVGHIHGNMNCRDWRALLEPLTHDFGERWSREQPYTAIGDCVEVVCFTFEQEQEMSRAARESPAAAKKLWMSWQPLIDQLADLAE